MSFLIAPVQRLPRYLLLLQDLIKNTPPNHLGKTLPGEILKIQITLRCVEHLKKSNQLLSK
jgi:hypothetical protein